MLFVLATMAFLFAAFTAGTTATHVTCTWVPGPGAPSQYGFKKWCIAKNVPDGPDSVKEHYSCENNQGHEVTVATWNAAGKNVLAINTACGDDGFMIDGNACYPNAVAVCLDVSNPDSPKNCKYLAAQDDCTWPDPVAPSSVPSAIGVFSRR